MLKILYGLLFLIALVSFIVIFSSNAAMGNSYSLYFLSNMVPALAILALTYIVGIATGIFGILFIKSLLQNNYGWDEFDL